MVDLRQSELRGGLSSDDTRVMIDALGELGCGIERESETEPGTETWRVQGCSGRLRAPAGPLYVENSGTSARFLSAAATLAEARP